jgi:hypothetical protein
VGILVLACGDGNVLLPVCDIAESDGLTGPVLDGAPVAPGLGRRRSLLLSSSMRAASHPGTTRRAELEVRAPADPPRTTSWSTSDSVDSAVE